MTEWSTFRRRSTATWWWAAGAARTPMPSTPIIPTIGRSTPSTAPSVPATSAAGIPSGRCCGSIPRSTAAPSASGISAHPRLDAARARYTMDHMDCTTPPATSIPAMGCSPRSAMAGSTPGGRYGRDPGRHHRRQDRHHRRTVMLEILERSSPGFCRYDPVLDTFVAWNSGADVYHPRCRGQGLDQASAGGDQQRGARQAGPMGHLRPLPLRPLAQRLPSSATASARMSSSTACRASAPTSSPRSPRARPGPPSTATSWCPG